MKRFALSLFVFALSVSFGFADEDLESAKAEFQQIDRDLNKVYQQAKSKLSEWQFEALQEEQRDWLAYRDARAEQAAVYDGSPDFQGKEKTSPEYWRALGYLSETRIDMISGWLQLPEDEEVPWEGIWMDGRGGEILIAVTEPDKTIQFQISVVRGPTYHSGELSGLADLNGEMGFFSDGPIGTPNPNGEPQAWLVFEKDYSIPLLEISAASTNMYHGARAYFHGKYTWAGPLDAADKATLLKGERVGGER